MRDAFIFYRSFHESAKVLNDEDRLALYDSIIEFALNQTETEAKPMVNAFFSLIKPQIQANNRRYENGKKGGRPSQIETETKPKQNLNKTETKPKEKEKDKDKDKDKDKEKGCRLENLSQIDKQSLFNFMKAHCLEKSIDEIEIEKFIDYWKSVSGVKGIKKDWEATFRNHCRSEYVKKVSNNNINGYGMDTGGYSL